MCKMTSTGGPQSTSSLSIGRQACHLRLDGPVIAHDILNRTETALLHFLEQQLPQPASGVVWIVASSTEFNLAITHCRLKQLV